MAIFLFFKENNNIKLFVLSKPSTICEGLWTIPWAIILICRSWRAYAKQHQFRSVAVLFRNRLCTIRRDLIKNEPPKLTSACLLGVYKRLHNVCMIKGACFRVMWNSYLSLRLSSFFRALFDTRAYWILIRFKPIGHGNWWVGGAVARISISVFNDFQVLP